MGREIAGLSLAPLTEGDEPAVVALWNRALGDTFRLCQRLLHQTTFRDPEFREGDALLARWRGRLVGFVVARTRPPAPGIWSEVGWLEVIVVDPSCQRQGIGTALAAEAESRLKSQGKEQVWAGGGPAMFFPGVSTLLAPAQRFLEGRGYAFWHETHDLLGDLAAVPHPGSIEQALARAGAEVRPCTEAERDATQEFLAREFPGVWTEDRRRQRAMGAEAEDIYLLWAAGNVVGLAQTYRAGGAVLGPSVYWAPALGVAAGGLGPIGVAEAWRGRALGLALLTLALQGLRSRGVSHAIIDWTNLLDFYGRVGFRVWRTYRLGGKELA